MPKIVPIPYQTLIRIFEMDGFTVRSRKGDHITMVKAGISKPLVIKASPGDVPVAHIRTYMTTAGISRERYFELLQQAK